MFHGAQVPSRTETAEVRSAWQEQQGQISSAGKTKCEIKQYLQQEYKDFRGEIKTKLYNK